jgi:hypothetical protein
VRFRKDFNKVETFVNEVRRAEMLIRNHPVYGAKRERVAG